MVIPPVQEIPPEVARGLRGVFFDIDDTITTSGRIPPASYKALWDLKSAGLKVVPVTGRPAGWCDHIARMWPVDGIVGENGAFYFRFDEKRRRLAKRFLYPDDVRAANRRRLVQVQDEILARVPGSALASDHPYRETDTAIDYCEDVEPLGQEAVDRICEIFRKHGATCKVSSVHVNGWFGEYDKLGMTRTLAGELWDLELDAEKGRFLFCGDSPNDEPMFQYFPVTAGVSNILRFAGGMRYLPSFAASLEGGEGFAEIVGILLEKRQGPLGGSP